MDAQVFWDVIGRYNQQTLAIQILLLVFVLSAVSISFAGKVQWLAKLALGVANLFIGIVFFGIYGTEPIQMFFALPLYLVCGGLFLYESLRSREDALGRPDGWQAALLVLYALYPAVSILLGNRFPRMVTHIMPCPVVSLSIAVYAGYQKKNLVLLALLTMWGLTGVKSLIFSAYEDIILLICGIYGVVLTAKELKKRKGRA